MIRPHRFGAAGMMCLFSLPAIELPHGHRVTCDMRSQACSGTNDTPIKPSYLCQCVGVPPKTYSFGAIRIHQTSQTCGVQNSQTQARGAQIVGVAWEETHKSSIHLSMIGRKLEMNFLPRGNRLVEHLVAYKLNRCQNSKGTTRSSIEVKTMCTCS